METVMEMDDLNQHECMAVLLALINHMRSNNIYSVPKESSSTTELPTWMTYLQKKMTNKETNINIKLFIAKLIINEPKVRSHVCFIKFWSFDVKPRPSFISFFLPLFYQWSRRKDSSQIQSRDWNSITTKPILSQSQYKKQDFSLKIFQDFA